MNKIVSVIIPTHSGHDTIVKTLESVLNQSYTNLEIIICDDNGENTQNQLLTQKAVEPLLKKDKRIKYIISKENKNGSSARNIAMRASHGEYISFLDDDDEYMRECIQKEVETFERLDDEYGIVFVSFLQTYDGRKDIIFKSDFKGDVIQDFLLGKIESPSSIISIRREVIKKVGYWDESFFRHQDWEYIIRILDKYKAYGITDVLVKRKIVFRHNAKKPELYEKNRLHFLNKMKKYIEKQPKEIVKRIYSRHYYEIGKEYFKAHRFLKSIMYACKTKNPLLSMIKYFFDAINYIKKLT